MTASVRVAAAVVGVAMAAYGALRLLDLGWANTWDTIQWLVGGVVLHDGVFAGLTLAAAFVALRLVPRDRLAPVVVALVVLVPTTLLAIPELGRFGARADNPTLLDRHYWLGWFALVAVVLVAVLAGILLSSYAGRGRRRPVGRSAGGDDGQGARGR
ncbi:hypothetical protein [Nocardioides cynanchi]|uniref:hypothetical protein n=1 Tax=Nocardioides cynanchi TaxID=2558918 RepID=UPI0012443775|nr:hypothetical protein [Nocardioides cynanchi]